MINIDVYPRHKDFEDLLELYPLQPANRYLPDWYKQTKITKHIDDKGFNQNLHTLKDVLLYKMKY